MSGDQLDLDAFETHHLGVSAEWDGCPCFWGHYDDCPTLALVAEVRRLREALETIAGDDLDYLGRLRLTDTENAIYVIARDALGRKS